ncbi:MAG: TRAP transporter substrate-binding protein [Alphaproteobacteria bacterium]|nr:TRAP transporter substrate-binding protein [Alphaproteobacteria bacterium]
MKRLLSLAVAGALSIAAGAASAQTRWQMPTPYAPQNFHTVNVQQFVDEIKAGTNGRLDITVHAAGTLLPLPQILRNVQTGDVQMGEVLLSALENEDPIFGADAVPFLVTGYDAALRLYQAQRPLLERRLSARGIRLLYAVAWPPQGFYANRAINTIADLRGLNFRSYGPSAARFGELVGAAVSTIQAAELSQALATGRVNSMITSSVTGTDSRVWESPVRFYYEIDAWVPKNMVVVNERAFQSLDQATRDLMLRAAASAEQRGWAASRAASQRGLETLRQNGVQVSRPSEQLMRELRAVGVRMAADWEGRAGAEGQALMAPFKQ